MDPAHARNLAVATVPGAARRADARRAVIGTSSAARFTYGPPPHDWGEPVRRRTTTIMAAGLAAAALLAPLVAPADAPEVLAAVPAAAATADVCEGAPRAPYVDISDTDTHAAGIDCLHGLGVIRGRVVDAFEPSSTVRRDQMASIVAGAIEAAGGSLPAPERGAFVDVGDGPHRDAVERLAAAGVVAGRAAGRYDPGARVPRGQMAVFLVRAHDHLVGATDDPAPSRFDDTAGHPHEAYIDRAAQLSLATGRTSSEFRPQELTARAQTATFAARLLGRANLVGALDGSSWGFTSSVSSLPDTLRRQMTGSSWRSGCPVPLSDLRLLEIVHRGFDGRDRVGLLVLHRDVVADVRSALAAAYQADLRIERMRLIDRYGADDDRSMADNNSSAFNCRRTTGSSSWSEHAYGRAIDLNPVQNPYVRGSTVLPPAGSAYTDRSHVRRGMLTRDGATVQAFLDRGWGWGGDWSSVKDYQHLSSTGR